VPAKLPRQLVMLAEWVEQLQQDVIDLAADSDSWTTPADLLAQVLLAEGIERFDLDPCSNAAARVPAARSICLPDDGLSSPWIDRGVVWLNPPFSDPGPWLRRTCQEIARAAHLDHPLIVWGVVKADLSTRWARWLDPAHLLFPARRIAYVRPGSDQPERGANFASVLFRYSAASWPTVPAPSDWLPVLKLQERIGGRAVNRSIFPEWPDGTTTEDLQAQGVSLWVEQQPDQRRSALGWPDRGGSGTPQRLASEAPHSAPPAHKSKKRTGERKQQKGGRRGQAQP
jgi:hypothetical protein